MALLSIQNLNEGGDIVDYLDIRNKFVELSGRYDLINVDETDNGADFFLNSGQQYLDRLQNTGKMQAKMVKSVAAGTIKVYCEGLRAVKEVWIGTTLDGLSQLGKCDLEYLRSLYGMQISSVDQGQPEWYSPAIFRPFIDTGDSTTLSGYYDVDDLIIPTAGVPLHYTNTGIIIAPPPDKTYYVSIYGLYYSPVLSATLSNAVWTQTKSFWSEAFSDVLIQAGLMKLETFYRNSEGAKDWESGIMKDMSGFDKDAAEEEAANISEMGG